MGIGRILREDRALPCPGSIVFQPFPYGFEVDAKLALDRQLAPSHAAQANDLLKKSTPILMPIVLLSCCASLEQLSFPTLAAHLIIRIDPRHKRFSDITNNVVSPLHDILQGIGTVTQEMPTIGNLLRLRRSLTGATRISTGPVPSDDFNAGMIGKPS